MKVLATMLAIAMLALSSPSGGMGADKTDPPSEGEPLPELRLPAPEDSSLRDYLGIGPEGAFGISQVRADVVVLEIFSMYCPYCQKEAPAVNELYRLIDEREAVRGRIKIIGVGAGNSAFEVDVFRKEYQVPFPLLPDEDLVTHAALGGTRTPYFIAVKISEGGDPRVIYSKLGRFGEADEFLDLLVKRADF